MYVYALLQIHRYNELLFYEMKDGSAGESLRILHSLQQLYANIGNINVTQVRYFTQCLDIGL